MIRLKFINSLLKVTDQPVDNLALFCISYVQDTYGFKKVCIFGCCIFFFFWHLAQTPSFLNFPT